MLRRVGPPRQPLEDNPKLKTKWWCTNRSPPPKKTKNQHPQNPPQKTKNDAEGGVRARRWYWRGWRSRAGNWLWRERPKHTGGHVLIDCLARLRHLVALKDVNRALHQIAGTNQPQHRHSIVTAQSQHSHRASDRRHLTQSAPEAYAPGTHARMRVPRGAAVLWGAAEC